MSCPRCGSGAIYKSRCRDCGFEVKIHRVTGANPPVGRIPKFCEATGTTRNPEGAAVQRPSAERPAGVSPAPWLLGEGDDEESTTADPTVRSRPARALAPPSTAAPAEPLAAGTTGGSAPDNKASWYAAAGLAMPRPDLVLGGSMAATARGPLSEFGAEGLAAALVAGCQALASAAGIFLGQGIYAGLGALLQAMLAALLVCRIPIARSFIMAVVAWDLGWATYLGVARERSLAPFAALPAVFLLIAFYASRRSARWVGALLGAALSLIGIAVPSLQAAKDGQAVAGGFAEVPEQGFALRVPNPAQLYSNPEDVRRVLASTALAPLEWRLAFRQPGVLTGGLRVQRIPENAPVEPLLADLDADKARAPVRTDALAPDTLASLKPQGFELTAGGDRVLALIFRTPDGRVFLLCAQTEGIAARARALFETVARGLEIAPSPAPSSGARAP
jgi:hypothetical protein